MKNTNENKPLAKERKRTPSWLRWLGSIAVFAAAWLVASAMLWLNFEEKVVGSQFVIDEPAPRTIFSSFEFVYPNLQATQDLKEKAGKSVLPVYRIQIKNQAETTKTLETFFQILEAAEKAKEQSLKPDLSGLPFDLPKASFRFLFDEGGWKQAQPVLNSLILALYARGIFDVQERQKLLGAGIKQVTVLRDGQPETVYAVQDLYTSEEAKRFVDAFADAEAMKNKSLKSAVMDLVAAVYKTNVSKDEKETEFRQKKAVDSVQPVMSRIKKNELIVQKGMLITREQKDRLDEIEKIMLKHAVINQFYAVALLALLTYGMAFVALFVFNRRQLLNIRHMLLLHVCVLLSLGASKVVSVWPGASYYFMPTALAPLLLVVLSNPRNACLSALMMTALVAPLSKLNIDVVLGTLLSGCAAILSGLQIRKRIQFVKAGAAIGFNYFCVLFLFRLYYESPVDEALQTASLGLINGLVLNVSLCLLVLPILESLFNLMTDITLLEISDLNHPLLKKMVIEAPGTYHHSLVVSNLAESACESIGANALLARVGCYFHDIGKIAQSDYFTENQGHTISSKHQDMTPKLSAIVIMNHVKEGLELGMKHKLKKPILRFIPEHHGTSVVYYFYRKALDEAGAGEVIDVDQFRYPGPKPQSRETAVALLADSVEASSRTIKEYTPEIIRRHVRKIINDKFIDGQLDECDLTLRDLHKIQDSFVQNLMAIHHTRVDYPEKPQAPESESLFSDRKKIIAPSVPPSKRPQ